MPAPDGISLVRTANAVAVERVCEHGNQVMFVVKTKKC